MKFKLIIIPANLSVWYENKSDCCCSDCGQKGSIIQHIISACTPAPASGKYTWRHNNVYKAPEHSTWITRSVQLHVTLFEIRVAETTNQDEAFHYVVIMAQYVLRVIAEAHLEGVLIVREPNLPKTGAWQINY